MLLCGTAIRGRKLHQLILQKDQPEGWSPFLAGVAFLAGLGERRRQGNSARYPGKREKRVKQW